MADTLHVLLVTAGGGEWAIPMEGVEQTFDLRSHRVHDTPGSRVVRFRDRVIEVVDLADRLGCDAGKPAAAAVVAWAGGRRRAFAVQTLVGQMWLECQVPPAGVGSRVCPAIVVKEDGTIVPVVEPGVAAGAWEPAGDGAFGFTELQRSALLEIANIGSGNAATALSQMLGRAVEIRYAEALLATLAEAADRIGSAASSSAVVDTPVAGQSGKVLMLFPDGGGDELCRLLGTSLDDEIGRSALTEVGNILASSYLNAIVQMTGMQLEPEPPSVEVDVLGSLVEKSLGGADPTDPTVLMRSTMTVETSDARFAFLFVPRLGAVSELLDRLGVGTAAA